MTPTEIRQLSNERLLAETRRVAATERRSTADLLALLIEVERRGVYLPMGYSSLFAYCMRALHLSEQAAFSRITAARAARRFPTLLDGLAAGAVTLSTIGLLAPHLTDENHEFLLAASRHKSTREVQRTIACLHPQPDIAPSLRRVPVTRQSTDANGTARFCTAVETAAAATIPAATVPAETVPAETVPAETAAEETAVAAIAGVNIPARVAGREIAPEFHGIPQPVDGAPSSRPRLPTPPRAVLAPLGPRRYWLKLTIDQETHDKLQRARALLRHVIPNGDPAAILDRGLTLLVEQAERTKYGATRTTLGAATRPRAPGGEAAADGATADRMPARPAGEGRYVPAAVKRAVWSRDDGRCAFVGVNGRCREMGFLEFHHVVPFAAGGPTVAANLQLRCRAHNAHEAKVFFEFDRTDEPSAAEV